MLASWFRRQTGDVLSRGFFVTHLVVPLLLASGLLLVVEHTGLDLWVADRWYALEGGRWAWRDHWFAYGIIHHRGKQAVIALGGALLVLLAATRFSSRLRRCAWPMAYLVACMVFIPAVIATLKKISPVPCPWDLSRYGGALAYHHTFEHVFGPTHVGRCFPAGHASAGFALLGTYFAAIPFTHRRAPWLLPGLLAGLVFGFGQQARGGHFLSHDLWTLVISWFMALGMFLVLRPDRRVANMTRDGKPCV